MQQTTVSTHNGSPKTHNGAAKKSSAKSTRTKTQSRTKGTAIERVKDAMTATTGPRESYPVAGLPLARVVPQDVHSVLDYVGAANAAAFGMMGTTVSAKVVGLGIASSIVATSVMTDYKLSLAKVVPIEVHEILDHVSGLSLIAAPFLFGYWKEDRLAAVGHILNGVTMIATSLVTDYQAEKGVGRFDQLMEGED